MQLNALINCIMHAAQYIANTCKPFKIRDVAPEPKHNVHYAL